ncbi:MAG: hypothetical protein OHK0039_32030 [Bacteroidia bacterium]
MAKYGLNHVTLIGNLGKDPELKYLDQGIAYTSLWIACTDRVRDKDGNYRDRTEWVSVVLWRAQAETAARYCRRGSTVCIEGRLRTQTWETPTGEKRSRTEVEGSRLVLLDSRTQEPDPAALAQPLAREHAGSVTHSPAHPTPQPETDPPADGDDLPF